MMPYYLYVQHAALEYFFAYNTGGWKKLAMIGALERAGEEM